MKIISSLVLIAAIAVFYVWYKQSDYNHSEAEKQKLKYENTQLKDQLVELQNDPEWLFKIAQKDYIAKHYKAAKEKILTLIYKHPDAKETIEAKKILADINNKLESSVGSYRSSSIEVIDQKNESTTDPLRELYSNYDLDNNVTLYQDNSSPKFNNVYGFFLYFVKSGSGQIKNLHLKVQHVSTSLLNIEKYVIQTDDQKFNYTPLKVDKDNDNNSCWEWSDEVMHDALYDVIKSVINSKHAGIEFIGQNGNDTKAITTSQKQALKNILEAYSRVNKSLVDKSEF